MKKLQRPKITRQEAVYRIALAGISAAVALLLVWLSVIVRFSTIAFFVAAALAVCVPLTQKYYSSSIFAYIVSASLSVLVAGDVIAVVGYIAYFGPMALITGIMFNCKVKQYIAIPIKILYINGALALLYFACGTIMIDSSIIGEIPYWAIAVVGTIALVLIDFAMQFIFARMIPIMSKVLRRNKAADKTEDSSQDDDYEDFDASEHGDPFGDDESPFNDKNDTFDETPNETSNETSNENVEADDFFDKSN